MRVCLQTGRLLHLFVGLSLSSLSLFLSLLSAVSALLTPQLVFDTPTLLALPPSATAGWGLKTGTGAALRAWREGEQKSNVVTGKRVRFVDVLARVFISPFCVCACLFVVCVPTVTFSLPSSSLSFFSSCFPSSQAPLRGAKSA
jgi:hypothetical protein